jgi:hypothetical protein
VVGADHLDITGAIDVSLSEDRIGEPVVLSLDLFYGVAPDIDVGLIHTSDQRTGFLADFDGGLCFGEDVCDLYGAPGVLGRYQLTRGDLTSLVEAGLIVVTLDDPFALSLKVGARARWQSGSFFVEAAPNLFVGLAGRTIDSMGTEIDFNTERLHVPIDLGLEVTGATEVFLQVGVAGPLDNFFDALNTPVGIGLRYGVSERLDVLGWFSFRDVFNTQPDFELALDIRSAGITATYHL